MWKNCLFVICLAACSKKASGPSAADLTAMGDTLKVQVDGYCKCVSDKPVADCAGDLKTLTETWSALQEKTSDARAKNAIDKTAYDTLNGVARTEFDRKAECAKAAMARGR